MSSHICRVQTPLGICKEQSRHVKEDLRSLLRLRNTSSCLDVPHTEKTVICHLDINGTLIFADAVTGKNEEDMINQALANRVVDYWPVSNSKKLFGPCTYTDYVYNCAQPGSISDPLLKPPRDALTISFRDTIEKMGKSYVKIVDKVIQAVKAALQKNRTRTIVPSFYHMVTTLNEHNIPFTIVLRTFGNDLAQVKSEIEDQTPIRFKNHIDLSLSCHYQNPTSQEHLKNATLETLATTCNQSHTTVHDHYTRWRDGDLKQAFGKPMPISPKATGQVPIFFDDNAYSKIKGLKVKQIVAPVDIDSMKNMHMSTLKKRGQIVQVDSLEALLDPNYFLRHVYRALSKKH